MSAVQHVALLVVVGLAWLAITSYLSQSRYQKLTGEKSKKEPEVDEMFVTDTKEFKQNDIIQIYNKLDYLTQFTSSSKSKIEYDRSMNILKSLVKHYSLLFGKSIQLPAIQYGNKRIDQTSPDVCPEKTWDLTDWHFQKANPSSEWHIPMWWQPPLLPGCNHPPLNSIVTILFNFASEIPVAKAETLFLDAADCMYKDMHMIALIRSHNLYEKLKQLSASKLPNMQVIESKNPEKTLVADLHEGVSQIKTKYMLVTRNTERFDNFSTIIRLVRDISIGNSVITGSSQRNNSGHWKSGCYQVKQMIDQIHFEEGYDRSEDGCMICDYLSTPFGTKTKFFLDYLNSNLNTKLSGDAFYLELFLKVRFEMKKTVGMCVDSMSYTETSGIQTKKKDEWLPFLTKYGFSKVTVGFPDQKHSLDFKCSEVSLTCSPTKETGLNHCCYKEAEEIFKVIIETLSKKGILYKFDLPPTNIIWSYRSSSKNVITLQIKGNVNAVSGGIRFNGFKWEGEKFISNDWLFVFQKNNGIVPNTGYNVTFGSLVLPVDRYPGDLLESDFMSKCSACFNLLYDYGSLDSKKIWL